MPMSGGTRMLRARRKDCNVKPNRRLDRKSSRGMLFENEELRMRTITINAEVEQGQHALKKLRRENEQLRREMWCLRDEYDKMEKLLKKREEGEESDQENSDSDENCARADESDEDKRALTQQPPEEPNPDFDKLTPFGTEPTVRTFDGLSVIDEQTEETQTTESPAGCYGTLSRGNSANRTFNQPPPPHPPLQDEPSTIPNYPYDLDSFGDKLPARKKALCLYENGSGLPVGDWQCDTYDVRPSSPYPYNGSFRPSYQKRFQVLQDLPLVSQENGWIFPDPSKLQQMPNYNVYVDDPMSFLSGKPPEEGAGFGLDRGGPDVFVTGGYTQAGREGVEEEQENQIDDVQAEIDKIEISDKSDSDPKIRDASALTKSPLSRASPAAANETLGPGKLTMDAADDQNDNSIPSPVQHSVTCQNSNSQHARQTARDAPQPEDMPVADRPPTASKYQTKLLVTLRAPPAKKVPGPVAPRAFQGPGRSAPRPEGGERFQTLPGAGGQLRGAGLGVGEGYGGAGGVFGSLPRLGTFGGKPEMAGIGCNIPHESEDVLPDEESLPVPVPVPATTQSVLKPVKIPPVPPPRTSSCPKPIIPPPPPLGVTATHLRTFRKGKPLQDQLDYSPETAVVYNPLLMSQPIATSTPTISLKGTPGDGFYGFKYRKASYAEDSSVEEMSRQKLRDASRVDVPKLNKSLSSPSFGSFRTPRRKQSEALATSVENILSQKIPEAMILSEKKAVKTRASQNNASVSSSSGVDSPTKSDSRKRRVSIQLKKKHWGGDGRRGGEGGEGEEDVGGGGKGSRVRGSRGGKGEETDGTTSERERTNSASSRTSSVMGGGSSSRRKCSISSNRTYLNEEKIPWCGCWGNGCV